jgi:hypothetical protein
MRVCRLSGARVLFYLLFFLASFVAPTLAYSQALTLLQSGTRYAGTITPGFNGDFGSATTVSLNTVSGALNGDTFTNAYTTPATAASPVGTYPINDTVGGPAASSYTITVVPGTLTIIQASIALNIAANNTTRTYGAANPVFTSTSTGAINGDTFTVTYATTATTTSPVGTYPIVPTVSGAATSNYSVTTTNGVLTVAPATLTVTANNASRV